MFVKTALLKEKPFDETFHIAADFCRWVEAVYDGNSFEYIHLTVCKFDKKGISSTDKTLCKLEYERAFNKYFPTPVKLSLDRIARYEKEYEWDPIIRYYLKPLEAKGKFARVLTETCLRVLCKILSFLKAE